MVDLTFFCNEYFTVLNFLYEREVPQENFNLVKCSQDEIATALQMSKTTVGRLVKELVDNGFLSLIDHAGKYSITKKGYEALEQLNYVNNMTKASQYNCISLFAGVGGIELGFQNAGFKTIYANEIDPRAVHTYEKNFNLKVDCRDVRLVADDVQNGVDLFDGQRVDIVMGGFPCQAFSIAGYRQGFADEKGRGDLFFEIVRIIEKTSPKVVFLENVKNLQGHDHGRTYRIIKKTLEDVGYFVTEKVLNTMEYGNVPQNRERIYIVAFKDKDSFDAFNYPCKVELTNTLKSVLDFSTKIDDRFYYTPDKFSHYDELIKTMVSQDTVYQWRRVYARENKSGVCPTLTANMGTGGHNVPLILTEQGIRKLTPRECFRLQGFPESYVLPDDVALSTLYKQAGNSVSVSVIESIAKQILKVLK